MTTPPVLLTDAQIQRFICDGFLVIQPTVPAGLHETIDEKFRWLAEHEPNPGNNITARLPETQQIVESPEVRGALISLLGEDYFMIPHRFWHKPPPIAEERKGLSEARFKEIVGGGSHQDNYSPASPGRSHGLQYLRIMYYSHPMELINGPTHVTPGSQYNASVEDEDREREMPVVGEAGTVFISHFDLIHAGSPNQSGRVRNMLKLLFAKVTEPQKPSWNHQDTQWTLPQGHLAPYHIENVWRKQWLWLTQDSQEPFHIGENAFQKPDKWDSMEAPERVAFIQNLEPTEEAIPFLLEQLNRPPQAVRSSAIYALGTMGELAIEPLIQSLLQADEPEGKMRDLVGGGFALNDEAYALVVCGEKVLGPVLKLLESDRPWVQTNGLHVVSDLGKADEATLKAVTSCLGSSSDQVVSFACLTLGRVGGEASIPLLLKVLETRYDEENHQEKLEKNQANIWPVEYAIHFNAAFSLVRLSQYGEAYEDDFIRLLDHPFGQVSILAGECLKRLGSAKGMKTLVDFLEVRRWDASLCSGARSF